MDEKTKLEQDYIDLCTKRIDEGIEENEDLHDWHVQIAAVDSKIAQCLKQQQAYFNPRWGRIFRAGAEESYFGFQVDRFACIYMEKLVDVLLHSPLTYFRAHRRLLAHDMEG